jgi:hypothetical protein
MAQGNTIAKRPGNISINISAGAFGAISAGSTGSGVGYSGMVEGRFQDVTALLVQGTNNQLYGAFVNLGSISVGTGSVWASVGSISGGVIQAAQLYDPAKTNANGPDGSLFLVNGLDTPKYWNGPGTTIQPVPLATLPLQSFSIPPSNLNAPIKPKYVATLFSSLFYANDPQTDPCAVYVSNPFNPETFTINLITPNPPVNGNGYIPFYVGRGDGINGGYITGLAPLGQTMVAYKESSIYYIYNVSLTGQMLWAVALGSASVGALSPRSIVSFDTFHVFLGIDGVYTFDGTNTRRISENNPDLFDGPTALINNRQTAIGVRYGARYLLWFDSGLGYPSNGVWFDFGKPDVDGYPAVGTISGMNVGGIAPLRGPQDTGNFAWADALVDRVGLFGGIQLSGVQASSDFGGPITTTVLGKADYFGDVWTDEGVIDNKSLDKVNLLLSFPIVATGQQYTFNGSVTFDQANTYPSSATSYPLPALTTALVGSAIVGTAIVGPGTQQPAYQILALYEQSPAFGSIVQVGWSESSVYPWTSLGYTVNVNRQPNTGTQS